MERVITYIVCDSEARDVREVLRKKLKLTNNQISQAKFRQDGISKNGTCCRVSAVVGIGDVISVKVEEECAASEQLLPYAYEISVLYEDDDLLIVNKPSGMPVHPSHGHYSDTLANAVVYYYRRKRQKILVRPVGRLDLETSGIVVFAKNQMAAGRLEQQKKDGLCVKEYLAAVYGRFEHAQGTIRDPIGPDPAYLNRMRVCPEGKKAYTTYQVIREIPMETISEHGNQIISVVRARIYTGRTHQIRVHMASIGHPLVGDQIYGVVIGGMKEAMTRAALHAYKLRLIQPMSGQPLEIFAAHAQDLDWMLTDDKEEV